MPALRTAANPVRYGQLLGNSWAALGWFWRQNGARRKKMLFYFDVTISKTRRLKLLRLVLTLE